MRKSTRTPTEPSGCLREFANGETDDIARLTGTLIESIRDIERQVFATLAGIG